MQLKYTKQICFKLYVLSILKELYIYLSTKFDFISRFLGLNFFSIRFNINTLYGINKTQKFAKAHCFSSFQILLSIAITS